MTTSRRLQPPRTIRALMTLHRLGAGASLTLLVVTAAVAPLDVRPGDATPPLPEVVATTAEVTPEVSSLKVPTVAGRDAAAGKLHTIARLRMTPTSEYSMLGVTWGGAAAPEGLVVEVRTRNEGAWSAWEDLHIEPEEGPAPGQEPGARGGTTPLWVGDSDGVQVHVMGAEESGARDVRVELIDPQEGPTAPALMAASPDVTSMPDVITRRQWGADESLGDSCWDPYADTVRAVFVHHTVGSNSYSAGEADNIVRGIHAYHTRSRGWCDIGYNFLVSRYGQIFEGRDGGIRMPVRGAHAGHANEGSTGVSLMGNFENANPTTAMKEAVVDLVSWQLSSRYRNPLGRTSLPEDTYNRYGDRFQVISGHRDAMATACPGQRVYDWLPTLRRRVAERIGAPDGSIFDKWQSLGGEQGWVGSPFVGERPVANGYQTTFNGATIFGLGGTGVHEVHGGILDSYSRFDGADGFLGFPRTDEIGRPGGGAVSVFRNGRIYYYPGLGSKEVHGGILKSYLDLGGSTGMLGFPRTHEIGRPGGGAVSVFQNGRIYYYPGLGSNEVHGGILKSYLDLGGSTGMLGFPTTPELERPNGGAVSIFQNGRIYYYPGLGSNEVHGGILTSYLDLGGPNGLLGYPTTPELDTPDGGAASHFQNGRIYYYPGLGSNEVHGPILDSYLENDGPAGPLGYPTGHQVDTTKGAVSHFQNGRIEWDSSTGTTTVHLT